MRSELAAFFRPHDARLETFLQALRLGLSTPARGMSATLAVVFFLLSLVFVYRSFYGMRIPLKGK